RTPRSHVVPHWHARAWEPGARIAAAAGNRPAAAESVRRALGVLDAHDIPTVAWRIHATAWELAPNAEEAGAASKREHLRRAASCVAQLADALAPGEPL